MKDLGNKYADALLALTKAEQKLRRAFTAWDKAHKRRRALERKLDELQRSTERT
jgi:uncharacterized protein YjiS (DUF1127 family)